MSFFSDRPKLAAKCLLTLYLHTIVKGAWLTLKLVILVFSLVVNISVSNWYCHVHYYYEAQHVVV